MAETMTLEVNTFVFGLGSERKAPPILVCLPERSLPARALIAEHVRAELERARASRAVSLALHYLLADNLRARQTPAEPPAADVAGETERAWAGLAERRYVLVVDGLAVHDLDAPLSLTERSVVSFVRLLPLIGG
jgi:hypothetical protein